MLVLLVHWQCDSLSEENGDVCAEGNVHFPCETQVHSCDNGLSLLFG